MTDFDPEKLKHKPNEKHTLDEVLKSLQDLIHNDLLKGEAARADAAPSAADAPAEAAPAPAEPDTGRTPDGPNAAFQVADVPLGTVVQSLEELVRKDLAPAADDESGPAADAPAPVAPAAPTPAPAAAPKPAAGQQTFSFDDPPPTAAEPAPAPIDFDELAMGLAPPPDEPAAEDMAATPVDDLPVLTESIAAPPTDDLPVLQQVALEPPADEPAAIAARVIARLNANRRARGEAELDDATLDTLRVLLREEIERPTPGMEEVGGVGNKPPNQSER